jgi:hypothetical protein
MPAIIRDRDPRPLGRLNGVEPLLVAKLDFASVDDDRDHGGRFTAINVG